MKCRVFFRSEAFSSKLRFPFISLLTCWFNDLRKKVGSLKRLKVPEYSMSLDEEGIYRIAVELIFAFDEVVSLGHKENVLFLL